MVMASRFLRLQLEPLIQSIPSMNSDPNEIQKLTERVEAIEKTKKLCINVVIIILVIYIGLKYLG
jgi:hypothetical protein